MLQRIKTSWRALRDDLPGRRFERRYDRRQRSGQRLSRLLYVGTGFVLLLAGLCFMVLPGPGIPIFLAGAALVAGESRYLACLLDRMELWLRRRRGTKPPAPGAPRSAGTNL